MHIHLLEGQLSVVVKLSQLKDISILLYTIITYSWVFRHSVFQDTTFSLSPRITSLVCHNKLDHPKKGDVWNVWHQSVLVQVARQTGNPQRFGQSFKLVPALAALLQ